MPKNAEPLNDLQVRRLKHPGPPRTSNAMFAVGDPAKKVRGLHLQVTPSGARSWVLRVVINGKRRNMGLGSYPSVTLAEARESARAAWKMARNTDSDPIETRREVRHAKSAAPKSITFSVAVDRYLTAKGPEFRNDKHRKQWRSSLDNYAKKELGPMMVSDIDQNHVLRVLEPIWATKTETASRLRQRIEKVLDWAKFHKYRDGENPARWRGHLDKTLTAPTKIKRKDHHPAITIKDAPAWFAALRDREGTAARALEFAVLTAARSGEVRGMVWGEIDRDAKTWTVPAHRMKAEQEHVVPLTDAALAIIDARPRIKGSDHVFAAPRGGPLSDMSISAVMRRMQTDEEKAGRTGWLDARSGRPAVPHGCRSTFRDWAGERSAHKREVIERALAHGLKDKSEAAYARSNLLPKRWPLMQDWAKYLIDAPCNSE